MNHKMRTNIHLMKYVPALLASFCLIFIDQLSKYLVDANIKLYDHISLVKDVFEIRYIQNSGTAWGMFAGMNMHTLFVILTICLIVIMCYVYVKLAGQKKYLPLTISIVILISGAVGNMIDRIRYHYVIDFLYFKLIDFPIFNIADVYVVVSMFMLAYLLLFQYKEEDIMRDIRSGNTDASDKEGRDLF